MEIEERILLVLFVLRHLQVGGKDDGLQVGGKDDGLQARVVYTDTPNITPSGKLCTN